MTSGCRFGEEFDLKKHPQVSGNSFGGSIDQIRDT